MGRSHSGKGRLMHLKKSIGLGSTESKKERKTEASLEKDSFLGSRKMRQKMERD